MADSYVQIPPDGTGRKVRSITQFLGGNTVEVQAVVLTDEAGDIRQERDHDSFGRTRVVTPSLTLFDSKHLYDKLPMLFDETTTGSGAAAFDSSNAQVAMTVTGGTDSCIRQTFQRFNYEPGKSQLIMLTGLFSSQSGVTKQAGYFDGTDGLYLEVTGSGPSFNVMKGTSNTSIAQGSWNLDTLDGTGASGVTLDLTKVQLIVIDFSWLGVGRVRFGFVIDGRILYCHAYRSSNTLTTVFMNTPNLPIRYKILSTGGAGSMNQICSTVISEGGQEGIGFAYEIGTDLNYVTIGTTKLLAIAVRILSTRKNTFLHIPISLDLMTNTANELRWEIIRNPTIAGTALTWTTRNSLQFAIGIADNVITNGDLLMGGFVPQTGRSNQTGIPLTSIFPGFKIDGTADIWALCAIADSSNTKFYASLGVRESI